MSPVAYQTGTYSGFCSISRGISNIPPISLPLPTKWDASPSRGYMYLTTLILLVLIYPPEWKEAARVKCLAQEHNVMLPARAQGQTAQNRQEIKIK